MTGLRRHFFRIALFFVLLAIPFSGALTSVAQDAANQKPEEPRVTWSTPWTLYCQSKPHSDSGSGTGTTCRNSERKAEDQAADCLVNHCYNAYSDISIGECFVLSVYGASAPARYPMMFEYKYEIYRSRDSQVLLGRLTKCSAGSDENEADANMNECIRTLTQHPDEADSTRIHPGFPPTAFFKRVSKIKKRG
ncbi:MAG: hypothetical protein ACK526_10695 [Planctomyces sp.]